jgi:hypothetical protein
MARHDLHLNDDNLPGSGWVASLLFFVTVAATTWPLWNATYLPIQDLPQHLAAIRVLHSFDDGAFGFQRYFEVDLLRTQYLAYYMLADLLCHVMNPEHASRLILTACVMGTPYALRALLRALGRDLRMALFVLPLTYNAHLILGFVNFLMAIPLALLGLALAVEQRYAPSKTRAVGLAFVALAAFYSHVVPFALLGLGMLVLTLQTDLRAMFLGLSPLLPSGLAAALWSSKSPAGQATLEAARGGGALVEPTFQSAKTALADVPNWLTDVLHTPDDAKLLDAYLIVLAVTFGTGLLRSRTEVLRGYGLTWRLWALPLAASVLYFVAPTSYAWIWPIAQRFPLLALVFLIPVLPAPPRWLAELAIVAVLVISAWQVRLIDHAFTQFDQVDVGDFDAALSHIPPRQRVAGLIYGRGSSSVKFSPFIHYVAYYQARKGGAVMFTFADFPQSPMRFLPQDRPPTVPPRWEWTPERVRPADLRWDDYVLVRGHAT